jgi:hypothetical protein
VRPCDSTTRIHTTQPRLIYFDLAGNRGEERRIALHCAGIDFEDVRVKSDDWPVLKGNMPFGAMPVLEIPGQGSAGAFQRDPRLHRASASTSSARCVRGSAPRGADVYRRGTAPHDHAHVAHHRPRTELKRKTREALAANELRTWGSQVERQLSDGPFIGARRCRSPTSSAAWWCDGAYRICASGQVRPSSNDSFPAFLGRSGRMLVAVHCSYRPIEMFIDALHPFARR